MTFQINVVAVRSFAAAGLAAAAAAAASGAATEAAADTDAIADATIAGAIAGATIAGAVVVLVIYSHGFECVFLANGMCNLGAGLAVEGVGIGDLGFGK